MPYVLEKITPEDKEKILKNAEYDKDIHKVLVINKPRLLLDSPSWTIDRKKNYYLYNVPGVAGCGPLFHFFYKNKIYKIEIEQGIYRETTLVEFWPQTVPGQEIVSDLQNEIKEAFKVHGKSGIGNDDGMFTVNAIFSKE